ncbi:MFS transporter [Geminicoccus roseus]|uniref:MFS transporter n=1 Tax=Geminicoccus roseus TaxID=404900 RepID=UPI000402D3E8|nr:MFS transporter [Geminicoccus roseus]
MNRNLAILAVCQALFFIANTIMISTSPLVGLSMAPAPMLATLPLGVQFLGTMSATLPASLLMERFGRRFGLMAGCGFGGLSGLCGFVAIMQGWFWLFCLAGVLYGVFSAFCQYFRFTAADAADASCCGGGSHVGMDAGRLRARAIGWVLAGGILAAIAGPEVAKATRDMFAPIMFAGSQLAVFAAAALGGLVLTMLDVPLPPKRVRQAAGRSTVALLADPAIRHAFLAALVAYVSMNLLMTATPLAMLGCGFGFDDSATVIQWHVLGMFAPSFVTGSLVARFGPRPVVLAGAATIMGCVVVALSGQQVAHFAVGLMLLGLGWNLMFVGATTMLTAAHAPEEKARVQGLHDLALFTCVATSATLSGILQNTIGWQAMNLSVLPGLLLVTLIVARKSPQVRIA